LGGLCREPRLLVGIRSLSSSGTQLVISLPELLLTDEPSVDSKYRRFGVDWARCLALLRVLVAETALQNGSLDAAAPSRASDRNAPGRTRLLATHSPTWTRRQLISQCMCIVVSLDLVDLLENFPGETGIASCI
jgi:hypothetical protein